MDKRKEFKLFLTHSLPSCLMRQWMIFLSALNEMAKDFGEDREAEEAEERMEVVDIERARFSRTRKAPSCGFPDSYIILITCYLNSNTCVMHLSIFSASWRLHEEWNQDWEKNQIYLCFPAKFMH